jgi:hypothetical protein
VARALWCRRNCRARPPLHETLLQVIEVPLTCRPAGFSSRSGPLRGKRGLPELPQPRRALAAGPIPIPVAGIAPAPPEPPHELPAGLTRARGVEGQRGILAVAIPKAIAAGAPAVHRPRGRLSTVRAPARRQRRARLRRPLPSVDVPVLVTAITPAAPPLPREAILPTDATGAREHDVSPHPHLDDEAKRRTLRRGIPTVGVRLMRGCPGLAPRSGRSGTRTGLLTCPRSRRALATGAAPGLVAGVAPAAVELVHRLPADLARAREARL